MYRRAQLAIETMIVYGLVILVALSVIGGLLYFDILDVSSYLPEECDLGGSADVVCEEYSLVGNELSLGVLNTGQRAIAELGASVTDAETGKNDEEAASAEAIPPGDIGSVNVTLTDTYEPGDVYRGTVSVLYKTDGGAIVQRATGKIRIRAS